MSAEDSDVPRQSRPDLADQSGREARCAIAAEPKGSCARRRLQGGQKAALSTRDLRYSFRASEIESRIASYYTARETASHGFRPGEARHVSEEASDERIDFEYPLRRELRTRRGILFPPEGDRPERPLWPASRLLPAIPAWLARPVRAARPAWAARPCKTPAAPPSPTRLAQPRPWHSGRNRQRGRRDHEGGTTTAGGTPPRAA